jgi:hypothetical protein
MRAAARLSKARRPVNSGAGPHNPRGLILVATPCKPALVVLLAPDALYESDLAEVGEMLTKAKAFSELRVLVALDRPTDLPLAAMLARRAVSAQWLLGPGVEGSYAPEIAARMPLGLSARDANDFALAMSDIVVANPDLLNEPVTKQAAAMRKAILAPGEPLPALSQERAAASGLEPYSGVFRKPLYFIAGRFDSALIEIAAFGWRGWSWRGVGQSLEGLGTCLSGRWRRVIEFPPDKWRDHAPDKGILDNAGPVRSRYELLERGALFGSRLHRDIIWLVHGMAAFAVFAAVAGEVWSGSSKAVWTSGLGEAAMLLTAASLIWWARSNRLQERWTACRIGAEQLRIACMCLPLLIAPPLLGQPEGKSKEGIAPHRDRSASWPWTRRRSKHDLAPNALAQAKRAIRDQGLPHDMGRFSPLQAIAWLDRFVSEQAAYHHDNHLKLESAERRLHNLTEAIFVFTLTVVVWQLWRYWTSIQPEPRLSLLLLTAFGPALAAAIHGAVTRLGMIHRAALSQSMAQQLNAICRELGKFKQNLGAMEKSPTPHIAWPEVRRLALLAADAMGQESTSWHVLLTREPDDLP